MSFGIAINIAMEKIYKRLCWIYVTVNTPIYDHVGNTYHLSEVANKPDYEQKSLLQDLQMKDNLYARTNWIKQGEESLVSIFREESLQQIVSGIYDRNAILKNLSEQDICFDSED